MLFMFVMVFMYYMPVMDLMAFMLNNRVCGVGMLFMFVMVFIYYTPVMDLMAFMLIKLFHI